MGRGRGRPGYDETNGESKKVNDILNHLMADHLIPPTALFGIIIIINWSYKTIPID